MTASGLCEANGGGGVPGTFEKPLLGAPPNKGVISVNTVGSGPSIQRI